MNNYYFKKDKVDKIVDLIKKELLESKSTIQKAFEIDYKEWEYDLNFEKFIGIIESMKSKEYLPKFSKEEIIDGVGKIALLCNQNPYLIFNFILSILYTNNKVEVMLENKMQLLDDFLCQHVVCAVDDIVDGAKMMNCFQNIIDRVGK